MTSYQHHGRHRPGSHTMTLYHLHEGLELSKQGRLLYRKRDLEISYQALEELRCFGIEVKPYIIRQVHQIKRIIRAEKLLQILEEIT